jgi:hypothetical protein
MSGSGVELKMDNLFFERPILNSPYKYPARYWELDEHGQPTQRIIESRRRAEFTEVYQIEADFKARVDAEFNKMIDGILKSGA